MSTGRERQAPDAAPDRPALADLVAQLRNNATRVVSAQLAVVRIEAAWRARAAALGIGLAIGALLLILASLTAMLVGLVIALAPLVGAGWATLIVVAGALLVAALLGWLGWRRLRAIGGRAA